MQPASEKIERDLLYPIFHTSGKYWIAVGIASCLVLAGVAAFGYRSLCALHRRCLGHQLLGLPGHSTITNFVFWIGISRASTLISAILRLLQRHVEAPGYPLRRGHYRSSRF